MDIRSSCTILIIAILTLQSIHADPRITGSFEGTLFTGGKGGFCIYNSKGEVIRTYKTGRADEGTILANGNALVANGNCVREYTPDMKVVFEYTPKEQKGGGTFSCQRLANGNTVIGENSSGRVVEVDKDGQVVVCFQTPHKPGNHGNMRYVRKLKNGNYLTCHKGGGLREYTAEGKVVWQPKEKETAYHAIRLANGNTLVSTLKGIKEYNKAGETVWEFDPKKDLPDLFPGKTKALLCGLHILQNGNIVVGTYPRAGCFEITRDKKLVWQFKTGSNGLAVQRLDANAKPLCSEPLH